MPQYEISFEHDCPSPAPVRLSLPAGTVLPGGPLQLRDVSTGRTVPAQRDGDAVIALLSGMAGATRSRYRLERGAASPGLKLKDEGPHALAIILPEGLFTTYHFDPAVARPYFHPVVGPEGRKVTRAFPMDPNVPGEEKDHPHHRSFWTAYGEVNDVDDWSEGAKHGWIRHQKFESRQDGPIFAGFSASSVWTSHDRKPVLDERRMIRVYNAGPGLRLLDYEVRLTAAYEDIHYGDTKEGGILAVRVASTMDGKRGGRIENSLGGVTEKQCWGKKAAWLDYSGTVDGGIVGIGMMDHPGNLNHPCYWHARDYGLVGTNPFARGAFEGGKTEGHHQKKGDTLRFRYRVMIHPGTAREARVDDAYHAWVQPPTARPVQ